MAQGRPARPCATLRQYLGASSGRAGRAPAASELAQEGRLRTIGAAAAAVGERVELFGGARLDSSSTDALGQLLYSRHGELELFPAVLEVGGRALFVRP